MHKNISNIDKIIKNCDISPETFNTNLISIFETHYDKIINIKNSANLFNLVVVYRQLLATPIYQDLFRQIIKIIFNKKYKKNIEDDTNSWEFKLYNMIIKMLSFDIPERLTVFDHIIEIEHILFTHFP